MNFMLVGGTASASLVVYVMDWITESTSIFISALRRFSNGGMSEMVAEGEVVWGDGFCNIGDTMDVEN